MQNDDRLLEPLSAFNDYYEKKFADNAAEYFEELVKSSSVDVEKNRQTVKKYKAATELVEQAKDRLSIYKVLRIILLVAAVIVFLVAAIGIYQLVTENTLAGALMVGLGIFAGVIFVCVTSTVISPKINKIGEELERRRQAAQKILDEAWAEMSALNALFDSCDTKNLIEKTVPLLKIDDDFSMRRYDYLCSKYGFGENYDKCRSTIQLLSGEILGNPFVIDRELVQDMGSETYRGSLVITWTTTYTDSEGHSHTERHSETLYASVTKPKPVYSEETRLVYGNEAAPDLVFSHEPTHAETWSEGKLERKIKSGSREIQRLQKKDIKEGGSTFTEMANVEFDVLFNATDRNNEVQFRLLFTPLAQKNMLELMKDKEHFGDDFYFYKRKCLNFLSSEHTAEWDLNTDRTRYRSYDVDDIRERFISFNTAYFKHFYFAFAPVLGIPLYQQHKPKEYIYKEEYGRNYTSYEAECAANRIGGKAFATIGSRTGVILKTDFVKKEGGSDTVGVTARSFRTENRVDFVTVFGGDGKFHEVPVKWVEYIPTEQRSLVKIKKLGLTDREFDEKRRDGAFASVLDTYGVRSYARGLLCCKIDVNDKNFDSNFDAFGKINNP